VPGIQNLDITFYKTFLDAEKYLSVILVTVGGLNPTVTKSYDQLKQPHKINFIF